MHATEAPAAGAGLLRRLRRHAADVAFFSLALVAAWFLWPTSLGGCTTVTIVSGHSMEPTYYTGDLVVSRCGEPEVGDVVVYNPPDVDGARVIHRIIGGDATGWIIQGDNNDFVDPWQPTDDRVLGVAALRIPKLGLVGTLLVSPMTWISLVLIAGALVIWPGKPEETDPADGAPREGSLEPAAVVAPRPAPALERADGAPAPAPVGVEEPR